MNKCAFKKSFVKKVSNLFDNLNLVGIGASVTFFIATAMIGMFDDTNWAEVFFWVNLMIGTTLCLGINFILKH